MTRINTNVSSLIARHNLAEAHSDLRVQLQRLSTGLRINSGADDPAGLIVSERLRSEIAGIDQAIQNAERATSVIATAEGALAEIANLLTSIKGLVIEAANTGGLSEEEIEANQMQIDSAIASITRIANTTSFAGQKLLDGSLSYITSGVPTSAITGVQIHNASFGTKQSIPVQVEVLNSAERADLYLSTGTSAFTSSVSLEIAGTNGVKSLQFVSGTALSAVAFAVNQISDSTGVRAQVTSGAGGTGSALTFISTSYGSDAFVSVRKIPGSGGDFFKTYDEQGGAQANRDTGEDVLALINGSLALGEGTRVQVDTATLDMELQLTTQFAQTTAPGSNTKTFTITGGGAEFQLGPVVQTSQRVSVGIPSVAATQLGNATVGFLNSIASGGENSLIAGEARAASQIIEAAITEVAVLRGRLGAFQKNTLQPNARSLQITLENLTASESRIRDTDYARAISRMTRAQVLTNVGTSVLSIANNSTQSVLALLQ